MKIKKIKKQKDYNAMPIKILKNELKSFKRALKIEKYSIFASYALNIIAVQNFIEAFKNYLEAHQEPLFNHELNQLRMFMADQNLGISGGAELFTIFATIALLYVHGYDNQQKATIETVMDIKSEKESKERKLTRTR